MRKFHTFLFLLLALMYLGAHTSCSHVEADNTPPTSVEQTIENN